MPTRNEIIGCTLGGAVLGATFNILRENQKALEAGAHYSWKEGLKDGLTGGAIGGIVGRFSAELLGSTDDTVNYELYDGRKRVYRGITYEDRIEMRIAEHRSSGKKFTRFNFDNSKPRSEALQLEEKLIKRDRPIYNIQHNL